MTETDSLLVPSWILATVFCLAGFTALAAALMNWDWFFNTAGASLAGGRTNRRRARWIYGIAGALMIAASYIILNQ